MGVLLALRRLILAFLRSCKGLARVTGKLRYTTDWRGSENLFSLSFFTSFCASAIFRYDQATDKLPLLLVLNLIS